MAGVCQEGHGPGDSGADHSAYSGLMRLCWLQQHVSARSPLDVVPLCDVHGSCGQYRRPEPCRGGLQSLPTSARFCLTQILTGQHRRVPTRLCIRCIVPTEQYLFDTWEHARSD
eukprot:3085855-Rhodomonas_salina.2